MIEFNRLRGWGWGLVGAAVLWWLFADTWAYYRPVGRDGNTLRFAHFGSYQDYKLWGGIIDAFEATHPGRHVVQEFVPGWYGAYDTKVRQQIISHTLPHVSLVQLGPFADIAEHFADVERLAHSEEPPFDISAELDRTAVAAFTVTPDAGGPSLRALPVAGGNLLIYCNPDCFTSAGQARGSDLALPDDDWTMEDFIELAQMLTCDLDGDGVIDQWGFWLPRWVYYLPFLWSFGADVMDESETRWLLNGPQAEAALTYYRELARDRRVCPRPAEVPQLIQDVGFLTGKVAMCVNGPWFEPFLQGTSLRDRYRVAPIPCGPGGRVTRVTWDALAITGQLDERDRAMAWQFVRFCASQVPQDMIGAAGRSIPARRASWAAYDVNRQDPRRRAFIEALAHSRLQSRSAQFPEIDRVVNQHLDRFNRDDCDLTPAEFLDKLRHDRVIERIFGPAEEVRDERP